MMNRRPHRPVDPMAPEPDPQAPEGSERENDRPRADDPVPGAPRADDAPHGEMRREDVQRDDARREESRREDSRRGSQRLGRGLAALIGDLDAPARARPAPPGDERTVPIHAVRRNPANPRRVFDPDELDDLAQSLRNHGFLAPIVVRPTGEGEPYEIVAGERRWRAAQRAELSHVPIIVREVDDRLALELAIIENVQRTDLNAIEEARGYEQLVERGYTQAELAQAIGKSRSHVANTLRLMQLPDSVRRMVGEGALSAGHARALLASADPEALARRVAEDGLTVRQTERLAKLSHQPRAERTDPADKDPDTRELERRLTSHLHAPVSIDHGRKGGRLTIRYASAEELSALCRRLDIDVTPPDFD